VVGHPGAAPGVSRSQAARISCLPRARGCCESQLLFNVVFGRSINAVRSTCTPQARFRRDSHSLMTRLTTVRLDDFGFGTLAQ
jgi:hypothetical protein